MSADTRPRLIIASHNPGKILEFQAVLGHRWQVRPQADLNVGDVEETGSTFVENALIKARHACARTRCAALADDSGLVVPALEGAPGLRSARYSGGDDEANNAPAKELYLGLPLGRRWGHAKGTLEDDGGAFFLHEVRKKVNGKQEKRPA